ncbi:DMT family transporter [Kineococcus rhizosphaerae]|uniref:Drug/metabolite transporter (DMT)-like permease n=1 Tax=Kineococcus rhizosphaerae TaxID=559628 RepID=A0A2T0R0B3_9ACTN|nr:DMT family transporter [Kineococcus rhizosphaerae]PRY12545.1 drug/metabolite transporter (DMT)-like permease [Kineococcus rhizosphaerae]
MSVRSVVLVVVWSSGFVGAELGARHAGPDTVLAWRSLATAVLLLPWLVPAVRRFSRRDWLRQAVVGLLSQVVYLGGVFWAAAAGVPAGTSALVTSLQPAVVLVATTRLTRRRLRPAHLAGLALGTAGVALTALGDLRAGVAVVALALPALAMAGLSAGTLLQDRWWAGSTPPPGPTLAVQSLVTAGSFTAVAAGAGHLAPPPTTGFWTAVAWSAMAGIGSYGVYHLVTTRDGAGRASTLLYLTPAVTAGWAAAVFGQGLRPASVAGLLVAAGAVVLLRDAPGTGRAPARDDDRTPARDVRPVRPRPPGPARTRTPR